jgi:hypothetical protein
MSNTYQDLYIAARRWSYRNFGRGNQLKFKSLFNASFFLIMLLTLGMLVTQVVIKLHMVRLTYYFALFVLFAEVFFMLLNYFMLLNNDQFKRINDKMSVVGKHNLNGWSVVLLVNVIITCGIFMLTV